MTDQEKLKALLSSFGIPFDEVEQQKPGWGSLITIRVASELPVVGRKGFHSEFAFTPDGKFNVVGIWE